MQGLSTVRIRVVIAALSVLVMAAALAGCGDKGPEVPNVLTSSVTTPFDVVTHDGTRYAVGHGVELTVPSDWVTYGGEHLSTLGDTYEWAVGLPADTKPLPAGLQFSMGVPGKGTPYDNLPKAAKLLAESDPSYQLVDQGKADVQGAEAASFLRFRHDLKLGSQTVRVEQVSLFVDLGKGVAGTIRFISAPEDWKRLFADVYDSVTVAVASGKSA